MADRKSSNYSLIFSKWLKRSYLIIKKYILIGIIILLLLIGIFFLIYSHYNPNYDYISILSGISTYAVALFTAIYAYISSVQVEEMRRERELQNQPLPWITKIKVIIEKPQLFLSGPNSLNFHSRYIISLQLKNIGNHPAVCIDIGSKLSLFSDKEKIEYSTVYERIDTLEEKQESLEDSISFLFPSDQSGNLIKNILSQKTNNYPILEIDMFYKNIIGGCFLIKNKYKLYPKISREDHSLILDESILKNWIGLIRSIPAQFEKDITNLEGSIKDCKFVYDKDDDKPRNVDKYIEANLIGDNIELVPDPIPGELTINPLSSYEYENLILKTRYSRRLYVLESEPNTPLEKSEKKKK